MFLCFLHYRLFNALAGFKIKRFIFWLMAALASAAIAANAGVIFQDDFEARSPQNPPSGWAMWGAEQFKVRANYTLDATQPHDGRQCFRISHPAGTSGYIVMAPDRAIHPKPAMAYTVSFWARADKSGKAMCQWIAYRTINPFSDAPAPGSLPFRAEREWKEYSFSVREGLDFFADQSRFLMLSFMAATEPREERTLWIDDVRISEEPDPNPAALLNDATLPHEALQHRLQPGDHLEFTVDATQRLRPVTSDVGGVSFHRVCGWTGQPYNRRGEYTLRPELETAIREMHLPMTRFYAVGDEPFGLESAIEKVADICGRIGVAQDHCVLEFEEQGASTKLTPEVWARGVRHSLEKGFQFHHWEIANEPYSSLWGQGQAFPTPDTFIEHFRSVSRAIREADPQAQIGMDIDAEQVRWGNYLLKQLAGSYDFVAPHYYCGANVRTLPFEDVVLTENYRMLDRVLRMGALLRAYNPGRDVYQYDTEWGMICNTPDGKQADYEDRNANVIGTMHRAVRLIYYARENLLRGASGWQMLSRLNAQGFGILSQDAPDQRFMLYWLYYYFNRHLGEWALATDGTAPSYRSGKDGDGQRLTGPLTPTLATLSKDGRAIYLVIANGSWSRAVACNVHVRNLANFQATGVVLGNGNLDGKPLLERKQDAISDLAITVADGDLTCALPPHAVAFVTLTNSTPSMGRIVVAPNGRGFVDAETGQEFHPWGMNYGNAGRLMEDFWDKDWDILAKDFRDMKALGANVVRVHLQFGKFMQAPDRPDPRALSQLARVVQLAEQTGLYLDITGLACYRPADVSAWYDAMDEPARWAAQARFWAAVAEAGAGHSAVFCYDLINEPLSPGDRREPGKWSSGHLFGDYDFLQFIALDPAGRRREDIPVQWIRRMTASIRKHDRSALITVGLLPWSRDWKHFSGFLPEKVAPELDFISVHLYPDSKKPGEAFESLEKFAVGKPVVIEETFPLSCGAEELKAFLRASKAVACGWLGHYDGKTLEELNALERTGQITLSQATYRQWLELFVALKPELAPTAAKP